MRTNLYRPQTWHHGTITVDVNVIDVRFMPGTNNRFALDHEGDFYAYTRHDDRWDAVWHGAYALLEHNEGVIQWYDLQEVPTLDHVRQQLRELHAEFMGFLDTTESDRKQMQEDLQRMLGRVGTVVDPNKVAGAEQMYCLLPLRDSLGRVNPAVFACRATTALQQFEKRVYRVAKIKPYIVYYAAMVRQFVDHMDTLVEQIILMLIRAVAAIDNQKQANALLEQAIEMSRTLTYAKPYRRTALRIEEELVQARDLLGTPGQKGRVMGLIVCAGGSLRLKGVRSALEREILPLLSADLLDMRPNKSPKPNEILLALEKGILPVMRRLDETYFKVKVKYDVLTQLQKLVTTLQKMDRSAPIPREQLPILRSYLRCAAAML